MRRDIYTWVNPTPDINTRPDLWYPDDDGSGKLQRIFCRMPNKLQLVQALNENAKLANFAWTADPNADPALWNGQLLSSFSPNAYLFSLFGGTRTDYNSEENGDGPGPVLTPTTRNTTLTTKFTAIVPGIVAQLLSATITRLNELANRYFSQRKFARASAAITARAAFQTLLDQLNTRKVTENQAVQLYQSLLDKYRRLLSI